MEVEKTLELIVTAITAMSKNMDLQFAELRQSVSELQSDVAGLKTDVAGLKTDVAEIKTDVAGLKSDVANLQTDVAGLKSDVADLQTDVAGLKTDVAEIKTDVAGLKIANETRILPALQAMGESWPDVVESVHDVKQRVEVLTDVQEVQAAAIQEQQVKLKILRNRENGV